MYLGIDELHFARAQAIVWQRLLQHRIVLVRQEPLHSVSDEVGVQSERLFGVMPGEAHIHQLDHQDTTRLRVAGPVLRELL